MKAKIHPNVKDVKVTCSCGAKFDIKSTIKDASMRIEICSNCHPFYTGEQRILKTWAVDKFYARMKKTEVLQK